MSEVGPHISPLLVGRDDLLALADRRIAEVAEGRGHVLLLSGEAGIGKTRLLRAIIQKATGAGFRYAKGDLAPQDRLVVLASIQDLARSMDARDWGDVGPRLLGVDRAQGPDSLGSRRGLVRDIVEMMLGTIDQPTLLAFEDLQWADEMTLEVIAELARGGRELPLLLVGVYRLDELPAASIHREWRARLLTQRLAEEARVQRLTKDQTALVTTLLLGTGLPASREVVEAVHARTNGIPLHVEELLAAVGGSTTDGRSILGAHVPDTIEDAILAHATRLSDEARAVARAGAVLGRCFVPHVLAGILDRPLAALDEPLEELVNAGILFPFDYVDEGYFDFRHQLLRDALYDDIPARDLRRFHARAAEFGASLVGSTDASLHFERAGLHDQAFRAALDAAEAAKRVYSNREAFDLYRRAVQNMPTTLPDVEKARVWMSYSDAAGAVDRNDICRDAAVQSRELALRAGDATAAAEALVNIAIVTRREGESVVEFRDLSRRLALEVERLPEGERARVLHVAALDFLAIAEVDDLHFADARALFDESRDAAVKWGLEEDAEHAATELAMLDVLEGRPEPALTILIESADRARSAGHETHAVNAYRDAAWYATRSLDYRKAGRQIGEGLKYAEEIEQSFCGHLLASTQAMVSWADGRWAEATEQGGQAASDPGSARSRAIARWVLGWIAAGRGDRAEAESHLQPSIEYGRKAGWLEYVLPPQWGLAEAALMAGDPQAAIEHCEAALRDARQRGEWGLLAPFVVTGVRAYQTAGKPEAAAKWLEQVKRAIGPLAEVAAPAIQHGTGLVKLGEGSIVAAREALEGAIHAWDGRGRRWEGLWARLDLATADLRANRYAEAITLVREVTDAAETMGSRPLLDRASHLTRLAKGRGAEVDPWHPLTIREFEVARKIAEGLTNAQIAGELFVSPKTVSAHVEHILAKLGAGRRAEIAAWVSSVPAASVAVSDGQRVA
jgi:DNA-binding CsgD family transcriptional regulator